MQNNNDTNNPTPSDPLNLSKEPTPSSQPPPPSNPYETQTPPNSPPPTGVPAPVAATVNTDVIGQAWQILQPQIGMWIVAMLIYGAVSGAFSGINTIITAAGGQEPSAIVKLLSIIISFAGFAIGLLANAGLIKMAIHQVRSGQAEIAKLFDITDVIAPLLIAGIIVGLATVVGFAACIIPGVIIALGFSMYMPLIVDQKADAIDSIKRSWEVCKPHLGALFLLFFVLGLINIAGLCACGLGILVTYPLTQIAIALTYRNLFGVGRSEGEMARPNFPPPPIASPQ